MIKSFRSTALFAVCSVATLLLSAPPASATSGAASPDNWTSTTFAGLFVPVSGSTTTQATVQVPGAGNCATQGYDSSVGSGAILTGSTGMIGAAAYTMCESGVVSTQVVEYNYNQWAYLGPPNMLPPGDAVTINIQPSGVNYLATVHMTSGVAYVTGPIGNPNNYNVGIWPRRPDGGASYLNSFGTLNFSGVLPGLRGSSPVDLTTRAGNPRATTGMVLCGRGSAGCGFPVSYMHH